MTDVPTTSLLATSTTSLPVEVLDESVSDQVGVVPTGGHDELVASTCGANAMCEEGVYLNGEFLSFGCVAIKESEVTDTVVGAGSPFGEPISANVIAGVDRSVMLAISVPGGGCSENDPDQRTSDWTIAFPATVDGAELLAAVCQVGDLSAGQRLANDCHRSGEPLVACGDGPAFPPDVLGNLGSFPQPTEYFGADLEVLVGTDDPEQLVDWHVIVEDQTPEGEYVQLLLRVNAQNGQLEYLLDGGDEVFDAPRPCEPAPME